VPIVAMTASALDETRQRCSDAGMNGYLGKPITADELDRVLATWLPDGRPLARDPAAATSGAVAENGPGAMVSGVPESPADGGGISLEPRQLDQLRRVYPGGELNLVLRELADEVTDDLNELTAALESGDQATVASAAHRIRNTGHVVGARELADTAAELDHPPQDDEPPLQFDPAVVERLRELWERVQEALAEVSRS
jgi:HPt (histidine-containing phosphotransfer) domain-containing protein